MNLNTPCTHNQMWHTEKSKVKYGWNMSVFICFSTILYACIGVGERERDKATSDLIVIVIILHTYL